LNATQRFRAPRHNQAGVAELPSAQKDGGSAWHLQWLLKFLVRAPAIFQATITLKTTLATHTAWPVIQIRIISRLVSEEVGNQNVKSQRHLVRIQIHLGVSWEDHALI
jgi:hypothetical protein